MTEIRKLRKTTEDAYLLAEKKGQMLAIRDWMIIDISLSTGLRVSELSKLKEEDLYLKLKPYKEEYDSLDRYDQIIEFFMYIIEHQLDVFAG